MFAALIVLSMIPLLAPDASAISIGRLAWLVCVTVALAIVTWIYAGGPVFGGYSLFFLAMSLYHGGLAILYVAGERSPLLHPIIGATRNTLIDLDAMRRALIYVIVFLLCVHVGALLALRRRLRQRARTASSRGITGSDVRLVGYILVALSAAPMYGVLRNAVNVRLQGSYIDLYGSTSAGLAATGQILAAAAVPGALFIIAGCNGRKRFAVPGAVLIVMVSFVYLAVGLRSPAILALVALAWVWHRAVSPVSVVALVGLAIVGIFVVIPAVGAARQRPASLGTPADAISLTSPWQAAVGEFGQSLDTVGGTVEFVPSERPHGYGRGYLRAAANVVPNFLTGGIFSNAYGYPDQWLVHRVDPAYAADGGGFGYSVIAEAHLEFGALGIPLIATVLGFAVAWTFGADSKSPERVALTAAILSIVLTLPRNTTAAYTRTTLLYAVLPYLMCFVARDFRRSQVRSVGPAEPGRADPRLNLPAAP